MLFGFTVTMVTKDCVHKREVSSDQRGIKKAGIIISHCNNKHIAVPSNLIHFSVYIIPDYSTF
jgi:hypothetical protein